MAFTAQLGTHDSRPGNIVPGLIASSATYRASARGGSTAYATSRATVRGFSRLALFPFAARARGASRTYSGYAAAARGQSSTLLGFAVAARGQASTFIDLLASARGACTRYVAGLASARGGAGTYGSFASEARGRSKTIYLEFTATGRGASIAVNTFRGAARGRSATVEGYRIVARGRSTTLANFGGAARGRSATLRRVLATARGRSIVLTAYRHAMKGLGRIANDALSRYELFRGVDGPVDLSAPWQTFTSLPYTTPALAAPISGQRTYSFVLRRRNAWNLSSQNLDEWTVTIGSDGQIATTRPSAPADVTAEPAAAGAVRVRASYLYLQDLLADRASQWLIYVATGGAEPNPAVDTPAVVTMTRLNGVARLDWTSPTTYAHGTVLKVLVRTRRVDAGPLNVDSTNTASVTTAAATSGPGAPDGGAFFGAVAEQAQ